ncbi:MAG: CBS domain-containing protein [Candidatus Dormiibacterota bacterium]
MAQAIEQVMTEKPLALAAGTTLTAAARAMRDHDVGDVIVLDEMDLRGIVTDRDLVVRGLAAGLDPTQAILAEICSDEVITVSPSDDVDHAVALMREHALRRLPVVNEGRPIGIVSLADLAVERDPDSALGRISDARPNR